MAFTDDEIRQAVINSTLALDRIARHEQECGKRWALVVRLMILALVKMGGLFSFLLMDKLGGFS